MAPVEFTGQVSFKNGIASGTTDGGGVLAHNFPQAFPTACIAVQFMPNQNKGAPVLVEASVTKTGFGAFYAGAANASRQIQYIAIGY